MLNMVNSISSVPVQTTKTTEHNKRQNLPIASVSIGDVVGKEKDADNRTVFERKIDALKKMYIEYRVKKLESTPADKLSENDKKELEANKKASVAVLDCCI